MNELSYLTITDENGTTQYEIVDKEAREGIPSLSGYVTGVALVSTYTSSSATLALSLSVTKKS